MLGNSVAYLSANFDVKDEPTRWLAEQLGIHLNADTASVLNYLRSLSGHGVDIKAVDPLYRFLDGQGARRREDFQQEALIFTPAPKPRWWRAHEVFWEDESAVFGEQRGYLKAHYAESLKPFFIAAGVAERAAPLDYVRAIRELAENGNANDEAIHRCLHILYRRLGQALQDGGEWQDSEEWKKVRDGECWLGRQGDKWGFLHRTDLAWNDHPYRAERFDGRIPFWEFSDLTDLAKHLEVKPISQAKVTLEPRGEQEILNEESEKLRALANDIRCFLESPQWSDKRRLEALPEILPGLKVCLVEEKYVVCSLDGVSVEDPQPRPSHLDAKSETIYLGLDAEKEEYPDLLGGALRDYFGVPELREFVRDLLTKQREKALLKWQRDGLEVKQVEPAEDSAPQKEEATEVDQTSTPSPSHEGALLPSTPMNGREMAPVSTGERTPEVSPVTMSPTWRGHSGKGSHPVSQGGERSHSGGGGIGEGDRHRELKERLAANPSLLGEGLTLQQTEYEFASGDRVDILLQDSAGQPITVEVESEIPSGNYVGVWQAVKYKHLAAVERGLLCEQVRSILVAPLIPDDVKEQCKKLGVEPKEVER